MRDPSGLRPSRNRPASSPIAISCVIPTELYCSVQFDGLGRQDRCSSGESRRGAAMVAVVQLVWRRAQLRIGNRTFYRYTAGYSPNAEVGAAS